VNYGDIDDAGMNDNKYRRFGRKLNVLLLYSYLDQLRVLPSGSSENEVSTIKRYTKKHNLFPLWSYSRRYEDQAETLDVDGSLLLFLYDYHHKIKSSGPEQGQDDYTRARVLWRLWHYEKSNDDVSVDVFPAITYDRKKDGYRKMSFLWRFFRYESGSKGRKLDLLFIPLLRTESKED
jgi:hypothetical protein